jgi:hypothetical protein
MRVLRPAQSIAAAAGLLLALSGAIVPAPRGADMQGAVVACVNGVAIREPALDRALERRQASLGGAADPALRAALIDRLVDEELLVQRAAEMGLVTSDRGVRKALARAAIDAALRDASQRAPGESELAAFYAANASHFSLPARVRVRAISFDANRDPDSAVRRAREAAAAIAGGLSFEAALARFGDRPGLPLPDALLPQAALRRLLGPTLSETALVLAPGAVSAPVRVGASVHLLQLAEVEPARAQSFEAARERVAAELARERGDAALTALLAQLRARAHIVRGPEPAQP